MVKLSQMQQYSSRRQYQQNQENNLARLAYSFGQNVWKAWLLETLYTLAYFDMYVRLVIEHLPGKNQNKLPVVAKSTNKTEKTTRMEQNLKRNIGNSRNIRYLSVLMHPEYQCVRGQGDLEAGILCLKSSCFFVSLLLF